jgi:hypothetical protein
MQITLRRALVLLDKIQEKLDRVDGELVNVLSATVSVFHPDPLAVVDEKLTKFEDLNLRSHELLTLLSDFSSNVVTVLFARGSLAISQQIGKLDHRLNLVRQLLRAEPRPAESEIAKRLHFVENVLNVNTEAKTTIAVGVLPVEIIDTLREETYLLDAEIARLQDSVEDLHSQTMVMLSEQDLNLLQQYNLL